MTPHFKLHMHAAFGEITRVTDHFQFQDYGGKSHRKQILYRKLMIRSFCGIAADKRKLLRSMKEHTNITV